MSNDQNFKNLILDYPYDSLELFAAVTIQGAYTINDYNQLGSV